MADTKMPAPPPRMVTILNTTDSIRSVAFESEDPGDKPHMRPGKVVRFNAGKRQKDREITFGVTEIPEATWEQIKTHKDFCRLTEFRKDANGQIRSPILMVQSEGR